MRYGNLLSARRTLDRLYLGGGRGTGQWAVEGRQGRGGLHGFGSAKRFSSSKSVYLTCFKCQSKKASQDGLCHPAKIEGSESHPGRTLSCLTAPPGTG